MKEKQQQNKHQHNTDEGGQAVGEDINITQMMVGKQGEELRHVQMSRPGEASMI